MVTLTKERLNPTLQILVDSFETRVSGEEGAKITAESMLDGSGWKATHARRVTVEEAEPGTE